LWYDSNITNTDIETSTEILLSPSWLGWFLRFPDDNESRYFLVHDLSQNMTSRLIFSTINTTDAISGAGTITLSEQLCYPFIVGCVCVAQSLVFCADFCWPLCVFSSLNIVIVLSVLRFAILIALLLSSNLFWQYKAIRNGHYLNRNDFKNNILIDWCLMPTLAVFQLYLGVKNNIWIHDM
jgi:hypothetical protein